MTYLGDDLHRCEDYGEADATGRLWCAWCGASWRDGWTECGADGCTALPLVDGPSGPVCLDHADAIALPSRPGVVV